MVFSKSRPLEILDILTWNEAFTIFKPVLCLTHPHHWPDATKYKLLVVQTARQFPDLPGLNTTWPIARMQRRLASVTGRR